MSLRRFSVPLSRTGLLGLLTLLVAAPVQAQLPLNRQLTNEEWKEAKENIKQTLQTNADEAFENTRIANRDPTYLIRYASIDTARVAPMAAYGRLVTVPHFACGVVIITNIKTHVIIKSVFAATWHPLVGYGLRVDIRELYARVPDPDKDSRPSNVFWATTMKQWDESYAERCK